MKVRMMSLVLGVAVVSLCSCASTDMINKAQGLPGPLDPPNQQPTNPNPLYYALVPVVFPFDVVAWPFQLMYLQGRNQQGPSGPPPYQRQLYYQDQPYQQPYRPGQSGPTGS